MEEKKKTHISVLVSDKEKLESIRDKEGYASIAVVLNKMLKKYGDKEL